MASLFQRLTKSAQKRLYQQHAGTGLLYLKTGPYECLAVEVYINRQTGELCRIADAKPVLPITIDETEEGEDA